MLTHINGICRVSVLTHINGMYIVSVLTQYVMYLPDKKFVGESNSRLARYSSTKIGECMC